MMDRASLDQLAQQLPEITFNIAEDAEFSQTALSQAYLDFYGINFSCELDGVAHGFGRIDDGEFQLAVHYWLSSVETESRGTLFLVHGYFDHSGLFGPIIREALERGFSIVIFDLPGHGLSSGAPAEIDSFEQYTLALEAVLNKANDMLSQPWSIVGQSTGGAVVVDYLWRCRESSRLYPFEKTALLAPLVRARGWKELGWSLPLLKTVTRAFKRSFAPSSHDQDFLNFIAHKDPLQAKTLPLTWVAAMKQWVARVQAQVPSDELVEQGILLIQGDADRTVDWRFNVKQLSTKFSRLELDVIEGAFHHLVREGEPWRGEVFERIFRYL